MTDRQQLTDLFNEQLFNFGLAHQNYSALDQVICREISFGRFSILLQHNPSRILSTGANIDPAAIKARKCFLCRENMPPDQKGIAYGSRYMIYVNPYPIFRQHFTIPDRTHTLQSIGGRLGDLLDLAIDFQGYTVFFNGPACGASAPDHFHFQMAPQGCMPLEKDIENNDLREILIRKDYYTLSTLREYARHVVILRGSDKLLLTKVLEQIITILDNTRSPENEQMFNILAWFSACQWHVAVFPRNLHRPKQFFAQGEEQVLFSPGAVDMAGLVIAPRSEDFGKYTPELLSDLFAQVSISTADWDKATKLFRNITNI